MSHWYSAKDGSPQYELKGKNGTMRKPTLRDARERGLLPSVTTITAEASKPGLENWKIEQAIKSALRWSWLEESTYLLRTYLVLIMRLLVGESVSDKIDEWLTSDILGKIKADAKESSKKAAELGTKIHNIVEKGYKDFKSLTEEEYPYAVNAMDEIHKHTGDNEWVAEESFATDGYGGKCDLHCKGPEMFVIDFKTTDKPLDDLSTWPEHAQQLSAYAMGILGTLDGVRCAIVYINVKTAEARLCWINDSDLRKGWNMFCALKEYWYAKTGLSKA